MNSLNDLLDKKADDLFIDPISPKEEEEKKALEETPEEEETTGVVDNEQLKAMVYQMKNQLDGMLRLIDGGKVKEKISSETVETDEKIMEGVFNGEKMIASDGKEHTIPPNYASKSKLVEGDMMKLTITNDGSFIYKQIGPTERKRVTGELVEDPDTGQYSVLADARSYKVITASVTFYKGHKGDEVVLLVPKDGNSEWGAVENIIGK